ncbi:hypothetical protein [Amycolatopsis sp. H20-H5]|uniref:hypothetical protein n=1 Tax=Amycolatopsis sp. H20-H5 TaxID=3046309 RepID=UPI002DB675A6|nr:hypothetical protein [Amycolatopsis sp. H20-H5]MEC3975822.1 hypothetical protein [Amycolatopsis sp. H20-H5]
MKTSVAVTAEVSIVDGGGQDTRGHSANAERVRAIAAKHRESAIELAACGDSAGLAELELARVAELHAIAYDELALAATACAEIRLHTRHSPPWIDALVRAFVAARHAEASRERAAAIVAPTAVEMRRHEQAAAAAERRASQAWQEPWAA